MGVMEGEEEIEGKEEKKRDAKKKGINGSNVEKREEKEKKMERTKGYMRKLGRGGKERIKVKGRTKEYMRVMGVEKKIGERKWDGRRDRWE